MKPRRSYPSRGETQGLTQADRDAMRNYSLNRRSSRYYRDLDAIDTAPAAKPKTSANETK